MIGRYATRLTRIILFGTESLFLTDGLRVRFWALLVVAFGLQLGSVCAQNDKPVPTADNARLIRMRIGQSYGLGGTDLTTVEPFFIISESKHAAYNKKFPDRNVKSAITKREWENLQQAVDRKALASAPQAVCNAIVDAPCSWVELEFSDKTNLSIFYDWPNPPAPVAALLRQIQAIRLELNRRSFSRLQPVPPHTPADAGAILDAPTAKKRAELVLAPKEWLFEPLKAELKEGIWTVTGTMHCQEALPQKERYCYGGAGIRLRKSDGAVLEIFPPTHN